MMFDKFCVDQILKGAKTVTRRLAKEHGKRPAVPGKIHTLKIDRTPKIYGKILIKSCRQELLGDLTEEEAIKEGFKDVSSYIEYFKKLYPNSYISDWTAVWRVEFELIE